MIVIPMWVIWIWLVSLVIRTIVVIINTTNLAKCVDKTADKVSKLLIEKTEIKIEETKKKSSNKRTKEIKNAEVC